MRDEYLVKDISYRGCRIKIMQDDDPQYNFDELSSRVCWNRNYTLSSDNISTRTDNQNKKRTTYENVFHFEEPEDFLKFCKGEKVLVFPLKVYEHGGITISMSNGYPYNDRYVSGQIGWVFVTYEQIRKEYKVKNITKKLLKRVEEIIKAEVKTFNDYLIGDVYGFVAETKDGEHINSCWGFYGDTDYPIAEAKQSIDWHIKEQRKKHEEKIKNWIKHKVPLKYRNMQRRNYMWQINIIFDDSGFKYQNKYLFEKLEDELANLLEGYGLSGRIENSVTNNTTIFPIEIEEENK